LRDDLREDKHRKEVKPDRKENQTSSTPDRKENQTSPTPWLMPDLPPTDGKLSEWASVDKLSELFFAAKPSNDLEKAGIIVHCFDATEAGGVKEPWRPCSDGIC